MEQNKKPGRPKSRTGVYQKVTIEIRSDLVTFLDSLSQSWRASIEEALIDLQDKQEKETMATQTALNNTLERFLESKDFKFGVISSTKSAWGGSGYSVELMPDGTWSVLWNNQIGNLYESEGVILGLPTVETEGMSEYVESDAGDEDDFLSMAFESEEDELKANLRSDLGDKLAMRS